MIVVKDSSNQEFSAGGIPPLNKEASGFLYAI
jgi:hypothetical protein